MNDIPNAHNISDTQHSPKKQYIEVDQLQSIAHTFLKERRRERRWRIFFRLCWFLLITFVVLTITMLPNTDTMGSRGIPFGVNTPHTAMVQVKGIISADTETTAEKTVDSLQLAFENTQAKGVILLINSPGGSPVQANIIYSEIQRLKNLHNKPVYAVIEDLGTSAAYYIAVAADEIYVNKASIVGSIGVLVNGFGVTELMEKVGIERRLITAGDRKGIMDPFSDMSPQDEQFMQVLLDDIHQQFITVVKEGRGQRIKDDNPDIFSGLFWTGDIAIKKGLVDNLGSLNTVAREVVGEKIVIDYTLRENVFDQFVKQFGAAIGAGAIKAVTQQNNTEMH
jgi:protease-4